MSNEQRRTMYTGRCFADQLSLALGELSENPVGLSAEGYQVLKTQYGADKARAMRLEAATRSGGQAERVKVSYR